MSVRPRWTLQRWARGSNSAPSRTPSSGRRGPRATARPSRRARARGLTRRLASEGPQEATFQGPSSTVGGSDRRSRVDDRIWKILSILLGVVCAQLIGIAGALLLLEHRAGSSTPSSAPQSGDIGGISTPGDTALPSGGVLQSTGPSTAPAPTPPPGNPSPATITFNNLALDAANDTNGFARTFTFT